MLQALAPTLAYDLLCLQFAELLRRLPPPSRLRLGRAALYLADDSPDAETMLFEAALDDLRVDVTGAAAEGLHKLSMQVCTRICTMHLHSL